MAKKEIVALTLKHFFGEENTAFRHAVAAVVGNGALATVVLDKPGAFARSRFASHPRDRVLPSLRGGGGAAAIQGGRQAAWPMDWSASLRSQ